MDFMYALIVGLIVGALFGFVLQRGRFCMNSAFRDIVLLKEFKLAKAVVVALAVLMVGFAIFAMSGVITLAPKPLKIWGAIVGGLVFGIGMVFAAGCASGTTYRVGEGMMGSVVAAFGLTTGALMTAGGVLTDLKTALQTTVIGTGAPLTLFGEAGELTPIFMLILGLVGMALMFYFWAWPALKKRKETDEPLVKFDNVVENIFKKAYPWWVTGIVIGIIGIIAYIAGQGVLGITGGWMDISKWLTLNDPMAWPGFIIVGAILGSLIAAVIAGEFKLRVPKDAFTLLKQFFGGILMGFGAVTAMGCNITNILGGVPQLSLHSIITGACIMFGSWIMAYLLFMRKD
ncbi:MAG: YeeE/YedE family protein [Promethearchaeota archaeon]